MDVQVRQILLRSLQEEENFGQKRIKQLSHFLLVYIQKQLKSENPDIRDFAQAQKWTALVYTAPFQATQ
ncbi:MAG: hypothetical protein GDA44_11980 [Prochloron sp. SP5CPC1]|nr:hypothetical protein [Candidatus Paraprochloron terpiosi SP5CPC1]